jgi:hypothetical protein
LLTYCAPQYWYTRAPAGASRGGGGVNGRRFGVASPISGGTKALPPRVLPSGSCKLFVAQGRLAISDEFENLVAVGCHDRFAERFDHIFGDMRDHGSISDHRRAARPIKNARRPLQDFDQAVPELRAVRRPEYRTPFNLSARLQTKFLSAAIRKFQNPVMLLIVSVGIASQRIFKHGQRKSRAFAVFVTAKEHLEAHGAKIQ